MIHRGRWNGCHLQTLALKGAKNNVRANCVAPAALASHAIRAAITRAKLDKQILFDRMEICVAGGVESISPVQSIVSTKDNAKFEQLVGAKRRRAAADAFERLS